MTDENVSLKDRVYDFIKHTDAISCVQLSREFGEGNYSLHVRKNTITAFGLTKEVVDAIIELLKTGQIVEVPTHFLTYLIDGRVPSLPIARRGNWEYKKLHWMPTVYYTQQRGIAVISNMSISRKGKKEIINNIRRKAGMPPIPEKKTKHSNDTKSEHS